MRETLGESGTAAGKAKAQALKTLLAEHACVTPAWLFDAVDAGVVPEERSTFALQAPGVMAVATAVETGHANEEEAAE
jgi:hypothetical protein